MKLLLTYLMVGVLSTFAFANDINPSTLSEDFLTHEVYFDTDKYALNSDQVEKLKHFVKQIKDIDIDRITIKGFCDDRGTNAYNDVLSNKRAEAIKQLIANFKINQNLITNVTGEGEVALTTEEQVLFNNLRSLNRKVVIVVLPRKKVAGEFYASDLNHGDVINLKSLQFKMGLRYLTKESTKTLQDLADFLVKRKDIFFTIQGHVCCTKNGREATDKETRKRNLSVVRAKFIRDYLVKQGVEPYRVSYEGLAGRYNLGGSMLEDRRVELKIRRINGKS